MAVKSNVDIMNSLRGLANGDFQERVPQATQENITSISDILTQYPSAKNEFINVLTNQVVKTLFFSKVLQNKLKLFHKGFLEVGESVESIFVDIIKAKSFSDNFGADDNQVSSLVSKQGIENVKVEYYNKEFKHKYKISISDERLKSAFRTKNGLQSLVNQLLQAQLNSAEYDEYLVMKGLIDNAKYKKVKCIMPTDDVTTREFTKVVKTLIGKMGFLRKDFNNQGVMTFSKPNDLVILTTPDVQAQIDVELLSSAFNLSKAEVQSRIVPVDEFKDPNRIALIVDKDFIQFYDKLNESETFRNADGLYTNVFLHKWGLVAQCNFVNAVELTTTI